jgi:N-acetylglucosaminyl-diphospho-decaprenol L-rhamnosyltransferase
MKAGLENARPDAIVDVVVVAYNSSETLRDCVAPLAAAEWANVIVVDNDSTDGSPDVVAGLPVRVIESGRNGGFAFGVNIGVAAGTAPWVLLLNPDAQLTPIALETLMRAGEADPAIAVCGPRLENADGTLAWSQRRFTRLRSTWAQAFFAHRLWPKAGWTDEVVRDLAAYESPGSPEWLSGACMLVRRTALEGIGGLDEGFFLYCEDMDLCLRLRAAGHDVRYVPAATARHVGGASSAPGATRGIYARSRIGYARRHFRRAAVPLEVAGIAAGSLSHLVVAGRQPGMRRGHRAALRAVLREVI